MEIRIPITSEPTLKVLDDELLVHVQENTERYIVDLSDLPPIKVTSLITILLLLGYLREISQSTPILIPPNDPPVATFAGNMQFYVLSENLCGLDKHNWIEKSQRYDSTSSYTTKWWNILEIKPILSNQSESDFYESHKKIASTIEAKFPMLSTNSLAHLTGVYLELCKNIFEHSRSFGYIAAQVHPRTRPNTLHITIGDLGVGVFESLTSFYLRAGDGFDPQYGPAWDELKALDIAFAAGVSSKTKANGEISGVGLPSVLRAVRAHRGSLVCRSGASKMYLGFWQNKWATGRKTGLSYFPGTQIEVSIPVQ